MLRSLAIALLALTSGQALAQTPRETVGAIAAQIREIYFSAEKGDAIADALEAEAAAGRYDQLTDPRDLAASLSNRLRPEDAHFNVMWSAEPMPPGRGAPGPVHGPRPPGPPAPGGIDPDRFSNYGFAGVSVLPGNIGLIEMRSFANIDFGNPNDPARRAADAALALVANTDAVIFDLRNNGGGAPSMVGYLVSAFTPPDANIYNVFHSRQGTRDEKPEQFHANPRLDVPVYVLISARTGSAAEAFPYTLQAARRATIVGEPSGGAANPGGIVPIPGGFRVFISGGSPVNPVTGRNWEGTGVVPELATPAADALNAARARALDAIVAGDARRTDAVWARQALDAAGKPASALPAYAGSYGPLSVVETNGRLELRRDRRPPLVLQSLGGDLFSVTTDPLMHVTFERDGAGKIVAVSQAAPYGPPQRQRRD